MVYFGYLKLLDQFKISVRLRTSTKNKKIYYEEYSSWAGTFLTITGAIIMICYFSYLLDRMKGHKDNTIKSY